MRGKDPNSSFIVLVCASLGSLPNTLFILVFGLSPSVFHCFYSSVFFYNKHFLSV